MTALELLAELAARGVLIARDGERLVFDGDERVLTDALVEQARDHKQEILAVLQDRPTCAECGGVIVETVVAWWGGDPVHMDCGDRAWRRVWKVSAPERQAGAA